ncbi:UNVERIFIED_CONTAM: hypothetical protein HDU68_002354 [Siphonaria sp. JEL0065]|nr:hypothetical protein HDU68_002354 [Siphonaria sp. JEL0065]
MKKLLEKVSISGGVEAIELVGVGPNTQTHTQGTPGSIVVTDNARQLTAALVLRLAPKSKLKDASIEAEFCGVCDMETGETVFHREILAVAEDEDFVATKV